MTRRLKPIAIVLLAVGGTGNQVLGGDEVFLGDLFTLTNSPTAPNGVWSWFEDERAIVDAADPANPRLIVSTVSWAAAGAERGDIDLLWRNLFSGAQGEFELHNQLEADDHNSAALYLRPDGRYLAMYSRHGTDSFTRWRVSLNPHDPTAWGPAQSLNNGAVTTYNNVYYLPDDNEGAGRLYNFTRTVNWDPNVQVSSDQGTTWANAGKLLTEGGSSARPYLRYASDGQRIHFIATEQHPRNFANSVYHGYIEDGVLHNSRGDVIDASVFDGAGVSPAALTRLFTNGGAFGESTLHRAWTINLEIDKTGSPVAILSARAGDQDTDHRFLYARYNGAEWKVSEMAKAGAFLYAAENDYTGLAAVDPHNPNVVYMSSDVDPITGAATTSGRYELYRGVTRDFGSSWEWNAITANSSTDNLRPVAPAWDGLNKALVWLKGDYNTYTDWTTEVVGVAFQDQGTKSLRWTSGVNSEWRLGRPANWDSGGGAGAPFRDGDEVTFDDSSGVYNVTIVGAVAPNGIAFNNAANPYTLTGGIGGSGGLRVVGGGSVTMRDAANTFTGDTLIATGTLALVGESTLSTSELIDVRPPGVLDVSGVALGAYTLQHQELAIGGVVLGDVLAAAGSIVRIEDRGRLAGDLTVHVATLLGVGTIEGSLTIGDGGRFVVGEDGFTPIVAATAVTYIDAIANVNTTLATGGAFSPPQNIATGFDNHWELRSPFGASGMIFESAGESAAAGENAPELRTTITGLIDGEQYEVFVYLWDAAGGAENWSLRAGVVSNPGANTLFSAADAASLLGATPGKLASTQVFGSTPPPFVEGNRELLVGLVGTVTASGGSVSVYIDDKGSANGVNQRSWYDGVGYRVAQPPVLPQVNSMRVIGDVSLAAGGTISLDVYSSDVLDRLVIGGSIHFGGTLEVRLADGAGSPRSGDSFDLFDFDSATGAFSNYQLPTLGDGLAWDISDLAITGELHVIAGVPGDFNGDGAVDAADYTVWRDNLGGTSEELLAFGSGTGDSVIDAADLQLWSTTFGKAYIVASLNQSSLVLPEPRGVALTVMGVLVYVSAEIGSRKGV